MARIASDFFVDALIRAARTRGLDAMLLRRGNGEAGAIIIVTVDRDRLCRLYTPVPQMMAAETGARSFECRTQGLAEADLEPLVAREIRFDSDCFVVELGGSAALLEELLSPYLA